MKIIGKIKCPICLSKNTYPWKIEDVNLWDDKDHEVQIEKSKEFTRIDKSTDNVLYRCQCMDCETHFSTLVVLKAEIDKIFTDANKYSVQSLRIRDMEDKYQKEEEEEINED